MKNNNYSGFISGLYKRNKFFLLISALLFFGSMIIAFFLGGVLDPLLGGIVQDIKKQVNEGSIQLTTYSLFTNNVWIAIIIYVTGISVGVFSAILLIQQGVIIGYEASNFYLPTFLIYTVPHGIFEISAVIISGAAGFRLASGFYHFLRGFTKINDSIPVRSQLRYLVEANADEFIDSLKLFIIAVVLLVIAAFIEANFTISLAHYVQSIT